MRPGRLRPTAIFSCTGWAALASGPDLTVIFAVTLSVSEFIYALAFIQSAESKTVPVAVLTNLVEGDFCHWGLPMAGALLGPIPAAEFYNFFKHYVAAIAGIAKYNGAPYKYNLCRTTPILSPNFSPNYQ